MCYIVLFLSREKEMPEIRTGKRCHPGKNEWMDDKKRFAGAEMRRDLPGEQISGMERWMTVGTNGPRHERLTLLFSGTEQNELKSGIPKRAYNIFEINLTPCLGKVKPEKGFFCSFDDFRPKVIVLSHCEENSAKAPADKSSSYPDGTFLAEFETDRSDTLYRRFFLFFMSCFFLRIDPDCKAPPVISSQIRKTENRRKNGSYEHEMSSPL